MPTIYQALCGHWTYGVTGHTITDHTKVNFHLWNTQNCHIHSNSKKTGSCLGLGGLGKKWEIAANGYAYLEGMIKKCSEIDCNDDCTTLLNIFSSVQFSRSVVSDSLRPYESQHATPPCPSQTPRVYSNSCPSSWWCHPAISSCVIPFFSCPQSLPASGSFPMSQLFAWGGQSIGVSASVSVLPMNT